MTTTMIVNSTLEGTKGVREERVVREAGGTVVCKRLIVKLVLINTCNNYIVVTIIHVI